MATIVLPNLPTFLGNFAKVAKSLIFPGKSFWATFIDIWRLFTGHTGEREIQNSHFIITGIVSRAFYGIGVPSIFGRTVASNQCDQMVVFQYLAICNNEN